jgi:tripartite-type tricarboxylate transporter receptor subunit TctC
VQAKISAAMQASLKDPEFIKKMKDLAAEIEPANRQTPEAHKAWLASETTRLGAVIKAAGQYAD